MNHPLNKRVQNELSHDHKILHDADKVWGRSGKVGAYRVQRRAELIIEYCKIGKDSTVLEIGCGTGTLTHYLAKTGARVIATDLSQEFLKKAEAALKSPNVTYKVADATHLENFPTNSFDAVVGLSVLHHIDIDGVLKNMYRVLKPGGAIGFSEPNMLNPQIMIQKNVPLIKKLLGDSPDETAFYKRGVSDLLKKVGFHTIVAKPIDFVHPFLTPEIALPAVIKVSDLLEKIPGVREISGSLFIAAKK